MMLTAISELTTHQLLLEPRGQALYCLKYDCLFLDNLGEKEAPSALADRPSANSVMY